MINTALKAKKYRKSDIQKIDSGLRARKWSKLYGKCLRDYHRWIGKQLKRLGVIDG